MTIVEDDINNLIGQCCAITFTKPRLCEASISLIISKYIKENYIHKEQIRKVIESMDIYTLDNDEYSYDKELTITELLRDLGL